MFPGALTAVIRRDWRPSGFGCCSALHKTYGTWARHVPTFRDPPAVQIPWMPCNRHRSRTCSSKGGRFCGPRGSQVSDTRGSYRGRRAEHERGRPARDVDGPSSPRSARLPLAPPIWARSIARVTGASQISPLCNIEHRRWSRPTYASRQRMALMTLSLNGPGRDNRTGIHTFQTTCL
jgi:hypothetical protein